MLNQVVLVGRIINISKLLKIEEKKYCNLTVAVPRNYKNTNREYDTDFIDIKIWGLIAENTKEYCKIGDLVGIRGRIETREIDIKDSEYKQKVIEIIAEKVTFLSSAKKEESNE